MNKWIKVIMLSILFIGTENLFADSETMIEVDNLIKYGLMSNKDEISKKAAELSLNEKNFIIEKNKTQTLLPLGLNIFLGLGIGSYVQGDTAGGIVGTVGDILGVGIMFYPFLAQYSYEATMTPIMIGFGVYFISKIFQIIRPFTYAYLRDAQISNLLYRSSKVTFFITPIQRKPFLLSKEETGAIGVFSYQF